MSRDLCPRPQIGRYVRTRRPPLPPSGAPPRTRSPGEGELVALQLRAPHNDDVQLTHALATWVYRRQARAPQLGTRWVAAAAARSWYMRDVAVALPPPVLTRCLALTGEEDDAVEELMAATTLTMAELYDRLENAQADGRAGFVDDWHAIEGLGRRCAGAARASRLALGPDRSRGHARPATAGRVGTGRHRLSKRPKDQRPAGGQRPPPAFLQHADCASTAGMRTDRDPGWSPLTGREPLLSGRRIVPPAPSVRPNASARPSGWFRRRNGTAGTRGSRRTRGLGLWPRRAVRRRAPRRAGARRAQAAPVAARIPAGCTRWPPDSRDLRR